MIVCICKSVNSARVREAVALGAADVDAVSRETGLGTGCGRCVAFAEHIVDKELEQLATELATEVQLA